MVKTFLRRSTSAMVSTLVLANLIVSCSAPQTSENASPSDAATTAASGEACAPEITALDFGIISTESQDNQKPKWEPFIAAMEKAIGRDVNASYATDYAGVIEAMGAGKVQIAWYGGKSYVTAAERSDAEAFAQTVNADGTQGYYAYLITNKENPILSEIDVQKGDGDQYVVKHASELTFAFND
ncbi:MAG TPA: phosphate/phosphite/phosphonate ABC transporter substrate-binding protein, partial [Chroococcidiopsis sp.]